MEPDEMPPPPPADETPQPDQMQPPPPDFEQMQKVIVRQHRVIELLKDQIGNVVLANTESAAQLDEYRHEIEILQGRLQAQH